MSLIAKTLPVEYSVSDMNKFNIVVCRSSHSWLTCWWSLTAAAFRSARTGDDVTVQALFLPAVPELKSEHCVLTECLLNLQLKNTFTALQYEVGLLTDLFFQVLCWNETETDAAC